MRFGLLVLAVVMAMLAILVGPTVAARAAGACGAGSNPVVCENSLPGTPMSQWYAPSAYGDIQGFSTTESVQPGQTISFKVTAGSAYTIQIYRLGWYGGDGARLMPTSPTATFPAIAQPTCTRDATTGLTDCGNWTVTASWAVPSDAVSGVYLANLNESNGAGFMPYPFVVTNPSSHSDVVVQTSDQTWQAYNMYGGDDLYQGNGPAPDGRAYAVSYNRPLNVSGENGIYGSEYPMLQWLERNGYDVSYMSGVDVSAQGSLLLNHKVFMSSGHDEYWDQAQWDAVTAAKDAGVSLAFFSGNEVFWRTRLAASAQDSGANRTVVTYKMTKMELAKPDGIADPTGQWTGTWMDPVGAGSGGNMPQNQLTGTLFDVQGYNAEAITVAYPFSTNRLWRNTPVAALQPGQTFTMQTGTLGYEWDSDIASGGALNSTRPPGAIDLTSTTVNPVVNSTLMKDNGNTFGNGGATHSMVEYRDPKSGALVFGSGTVHWSWGLGTTHFGAATQEDPVQQQATANLLADMGVTPQTLQSNLVQPTRSTDTTGPAVAVSAPTSGATVPAMSPVTFNGTATDSGGGVVARVELSTDNGATWQPATSLGSWSYNWTPMKTGNVTVLVRAEDDSDNIGATVSIPLTVGPQVCPCSMFPNAVTPTLPDGGDGSSVNLGLKFTTTTAGAISGVRFYKAPTNTGTHVGSLWTSTGALLGSVTFTNETASGWQSAMFSQPIPLTVNRTYVVSYLAPAGHYSADANFFTNQGAGLAPITALQATSTIPNGVYKYGTATVFPSLSFKNTNYYVDAVFTPGVFDPNPPTVTATQPAANATAVPVTTPVTASLSEGIDPSTLKFTLTGSNGKAQSGTVGYDPVGHVASFTPNGQLTVSTKYTASVSATNLTGHPMPSPYTWSFTTAPTWPAYTCPCSLFSGTVPPLNGDLKSVELGVRFESAVSGWVTGVSFYKGVKNTGTHTGTLWTASGTQLATGTFTGETASGWQTLTFSSPVAITANTVYIASYHAPVGHYAATGAYFTSNVTVYPLTAPGTATGAGNGLYLYEASSTLPPSNTYNATNYWVDVNFTTVKPAAKAAASQGTVTPASDAIGADKDDIVSTTTGVSDDVHPPTVTFAEPIQPQSLKITVTTTVAGQGTESPAGTVIAGTLSYNPATLTAAFRSDAPLLPGTIYRAVATANGPDGDAIAPLSWTFFELPPGSNAPSHLPTLPANGGTPQVVALSGEGDSWRRSDPLPPTDV